MLPTPKSVSNPGCDSAPPIAGDLELVRIAVERMDNDATVRVRARIYDARGATDHDWVLDPAALETFGAFRGAVLRRYAIVCYFCEVEREHPRIRQERWIAALQAAQGAAR